MTVVVEPLARCIACHDLGAGLALVAFYFSVLGRQATREAFIVVVEEANEIAPCLRNDAISRRGCALICDLMEEAYSMVGNALYRGYGPVGRTIIDDDDFEIFPIL